MKKRVTTLIVTIEQDPVPGWGNKPEHHERWLRGHLESVIGHYHPTVTLLTSDQAREMRPINAIAGPQTGRGVR